MSEITAQIGSQSDIELVDETGRQISATPLTKVDASHLARELLGCVVALSGMQPPRPKTIIGYTEIPVCTWKTKTSPHTGQLVLILTMPSGVEMTFSITPQGAKEMGNTLVFAAATGQSSAGTSGSVH